MPEWLVTESSLPGMPKGQGPGVGLVTGSTIAFFEADGDVVGSSRIEDRVALGADAFALYSTAGEAADVYSGSVDKVFTIRERGYPFFINDRVFLAKPGMAGIAEYSRTGNRLFSYDARSIITCVAANSDVVALGTLDGEIVVIGPDGMERFAFKPGGSRIEVVVGIAISGDGRRLAAVCGVDRQRLVVLDRFEAEYRVIKHRYLEDEFKERVAVYVSDDGRYVFSQTGSGFDMLDADLGAEYRLSLPGPGRFARVDVARSVAIVASDTREGSSYRVFALPDRLIASFSFPGSAAMTRMDGDALYFASSEGMAKLRFKER
jgi:hypothetical protein